MLEAAGSERLRAMQLQVFNMIQGPAGPGQPGIPWMIEKSRIKLAGEVNHGLRQKRIDKAHHEVGLYLEGVCVCVCARALHAPWALAAYSTLCV